MTDRALVVRTVTAGVRLEATVWHDDRVCPDGRLRAFDGDDRAPSLSAAVERLDFARYDGLYYQGPDGDWTAFLACWLAVEPWTGDPTPEPRGDGAVVERRTARDAQALRSWVRAAKGPLVDEIATGTLPPGEARSRLLGALRRRAGDRRVIVAAPAGVQRSRR
ncbi:DUF6735 family protein [Halorhabdus sp. CUG00001]|uniref:DUF6735 family protein n=1 Tax=Halorhabdus sp. CUG00001 TaxID=2600297 RepID=UPI00131AAAEA|nr:DUF6735 family protein [Halorhabdus sp. CUG00001]